MSYIIKKDGEYIINIKYRFNNKIYDCSENNRLANLITDLESEGLLSRSIEVGDNIVLNYFNMFGEYIGNSHDIKNVFKNLNKHTQIIEICD